MELLVSQKIRKKYQLNESLFSSSGNMVFSDFSAVRAFVHEWNRNNPPQVHINAGELAASGLLHELSHIIIRTYEANTTGKIFTDALQSMEVRIGKTKLNESLVDFVRTFPPIEVYKGNLSATEYMDGNTDGKPNASLLTEESMLLYLANENPANKPFLPLIGAENLHNPALFYKHLDALETCFRSMPPFGPEKNDLFTFLRRPYQHAPGNLAAQIDFILANWTDFLPAETTNQMLLHKDFIREETFMGSEHTAGHAPTLVPDYGKRKGVDTMHLGKSGFDAVSESAKDYDEHEQFTPDTHWMPRVVLMAKNTYVWLDQLSGKYNRHIARLDQIPDQELDQLAEYHINGLWLIGIWERSSASRKIKHKMGNQEATASAYALYDYQIAYDLGGEDAWKNLNERASKRGIRLAGDMVPNHTGIYSKWVIEHPEHFIQTDNPPFPSYSFSGDNLSDDPHIEIRIEDGYYNKTDAAVVFQRIDKRHHTTSYIYHGNDGTLMPWNDTAQLDMIKAEVREAVMGKIFEVARKFSIIRFDAAMTLAKKHFSRLWYPRPGSGGDIPSRASHAMSKQAFDRMFPVEFWREVVDRINRDLPETLLLAEAFWFMEGYFVRTLGMHRVYNSAFMHMLKNEENEKYRDLITNTLEFEPDILKRYVNFMSNPDEETSIQQFGTGDKYFGICMLMMTLPGLPMFAHGQVEGFTEKYGMEYLRARYHETPNEELINRHRREIFPLTGKRYLFSDVKYFHLFDYLDPQGRINENVFAYTNRYAEEKALILYNNTYEKAYGYIHRSVLRLPVDKSDRNTFSLNLVEALDLGHGDNDFYILREHVSGQEFLYKGQDIRDKGFHWNLMGFEYRVFLSFEKLTDHDGSIAQLHHELGGHGKANMKEALMRHQLSTIHHAFSSIFTSQSIDQFINLYGEKREKAADNRVIESIVEAYAHFATMCFGHRQKAPQSKANPESYFKDSVRALLKATTGKSLRVGFDYSTVNDAVNVTARELFVANDSNPYRENTLLALLYFALSGIREDYREAIAEEDLLYGSLMLGWPIGNILSHNGKSHEDNLADIHLLQLLLRFEDPIMDREQGIGEGWFRQVLLDDGVRQFLGVNVYEGVEYYSKEQLEKLVKWFFSLHYISLHKKRPAPLPAKVIRDKTLDGLQFYTGLLRCSALAGYRMSKLMDAMGDHKGFRA